MGAAAAYIDASREVLLADDCMELVRRALSPSCLVGTNYMHTWSYIGSTSHVHQDDKLVLFLSYYPRNFPAFSL